MKNYLIGLALAALFVLPVSSALGSWVGPSELISLGWGSQIGQVAIKYGDTEDDFPGTMQVDSRGNILLPDGGNGRLYIYSSTGFLVKVIEPQKYRFEIVYVPLIVGDKILLKAGDEYMLYDYSGNLVASFKGVQYTPRIYIVSGTIVAFNSQDSKYYTYSTSGQPLRSSTDPPPEFGIVTKKLIASHQYKITVKYPDKEWAIIGKGAFPRYVRDINGNLYGVGDTQVARYDEQGRGLARLTMPQSQYEEIPVPGPGVEPKIKWIEQYGSPVLAPNGDVYTWKRTPDKYSIIKWTWQ